MSCISLHSQLKLPSSKFICQHHKLTCFPTHQPTGFLNGQRNLLLAPIRAIGVPIPPSIFIAAKSHAAPGDLSVLLQTGAVMFFMYWIANFVVPGIILKDLQENNTTEDKNADENNL